MIETYQIVSNIIILLSYYICLISHSNNQYRILSINLQYHAYEKLR